MKGKVIDVVLFVFGTSILLYSLLSYSYRLMRIGILSYDTGAKMGIALGASMIVLGFVIKYWSKKEK